MTDWHIDIDRSILDALPVPRRGPVSKDRIEGMLLGLAIGDALGNTTEGQTPSHRRDERGEIVDYLPNRFADERPVGLPSDDSQLAFWLLEHLLQHGRVVPAELATSLADGRQIFGIGKTVKAFLRAANTGVPWWEAAQRSAGNGAVMRIAPVILPHPRQPSARLWLDSVLGGAVTHNDRSSIAACVALVGMLWDVLQMSDPPEPGWWIDRYVMLARPVEGEVQLAPQFPAFDFAGPVWKAVDVEVRRALAADLSSLDANERWGSGAFLLETVPSFVYVLARHGRDPEQAIIRAVNDTKDNDTVGAIAGAVVGALHGAAALPSRWKQGLLGRTGANDDGRIFDLIDEACRRWL